MRFFKNTMIAMTAIFSFSVHAGEAEVRAALDGIVGSPGDMAQADVTESPVKGLYQVIWDGNVFYATENGHYFIAGKMYEFVTDEETGKTLGLKETAAARMAEVGAQQDLLKAEKAIATLKSIKDEDTIIFEPTAEKQHTITVFTDIDCGYCRKLHGQMDGYLAAGIRVRYMFSSFQGLPASSSSGQKAAKVWCSSNQQQAITNAKLKGAYDNDGSCDAPIADQYALAKKIGVRGTPGIVTEQGVLIPGYMPPARLKQRLDGLKAASEKSS